jgi:hypothetical protein
MTHSTSRSKKDALGFSTPGMLRIIEEVHHEVDEHRVRNGQKKWDWKRHIPKGFYFPRTGWIATISMFMAVRKKTDQ